MTNPLSGVWLAFIVIVAAGVLALGVQAYNQIELNNSTREALCAQRASERESLEGSIAFLRKNPQGIPGIPAQLIKDGQARSRRLLTALDKVHCD